MTRRGEIDHAFKASRVEDILSVLDRNAGAGCAHAEWAAAAAATIRAKSPLSLEIALTQMGCGKTLNFNECMTTEFRIVSRLVHGHDFYEGVRALIIDKDNAARWQPPTLADVTQADVDRHFAPLTHELELP